MKKSKLLQKTINKLVEASFMEGKIIESQITKSIKLLKSLPKYETIWSLSEYLKLLKSKERQHTMFLETAINLSPAQIQRAKKIIDRKIKITKVLVSINPEILGGFRLRVGDEIWDESLLGKLNQIKEAIASSESRIQN